ncbi:MAG: substrate-binding domain-containing protein [Chloroflexota bacterium]
MFIAQVGCAGSLGGLVALQQGEADLAGIHLLDEETGEYNYPYVKHILPGIRVAVVHLAYRVQGFMLPRGNPGQIKNFEDLRHPDIIMVNRQKGSGTRVLLDLKLRELGLLPEEIKGYRNELDTHLAVATAIAEGKADVGLGIEAAAHNCDLDFIPLFRERYDLIMPAEKYKSKPVSYLVKIIKSRSFKKAVTEIGGYDTSETGDTNFIE